MTHLFRCSKCGQYTLEQQRCPTCGGPVSSPRPPRYSPEDRYGEYRRRAKRKTQQTVSE